MGRWLFFAGLLMVILIVLSRANAFKSVFGSLTTGTNTLARTFLGENTNGTAFLNGVSQ